MLSIFKSLAKYEWISKRRHHHEPRPEDLKDFLSNSKFPKETICVDCGSMLELELDQDEQDTYWVTEV